MQIKIIYNIQNRKNEDALRGASDVLKGGLWRPGVLVEYGRMRKPAESPGRALPAAERPAPITKAAKNQKKKQSKRLKYFSLKNFKELEGEQLSLMRNISMEAGLPWKMYLEVK